jgi:hypothetical protein
MAKQLITLLLQVALLDQEAVEEAVLVAVEQLILMQLHMEVLEVV